MPRNFMEPAKRNEARRRLEELIRSRGLWGSRLTGERTLAAELKVGRKTLRGALAELEAAALIHRVHGSGTYVSERAPGKKLRRTARLGVVVERHREELPGWDYVGEMIRGLRALAPRSRADCTVLALDRPEEAARLGDARELRSFDAFIAIQVEDRELLSRLLELGRGPVVLLDHFLRDLPVVGVVDGSFEGARAVVRHLLDLGHRRIAFLDTYNSAAANPEKFAGYRAALVERGLPFDEQLVIAPGERPAAASLEPFAEEAVEHLLGLPDPPTAIFGFDDQRALPAIRALEARGLKVPADISVAGFGDTASRRGDCDRLTSCRIFPRKMAQQALRAALGERSPEGRTIIVPNRLTVRKSTCPPPAGA